MVSILGIYGDVPRPAGVEMLPGIWIQTNTKSKSHHGKKAIRKIIFVFNIMLFFIFLLICRFICWFY